MNISLDIDAKKADLERDGFCVYEESIIPESLLSKALLHTEHIIAGVYNTGRPPSAINAKEGNFTTLQQIFNPHISDYTLFELVTFPKLLQLVANILACDKLQLIGSQLFIKPGFGAPEAETPWHSEYEQIPCFDGGSYSIWLPLTPVDEASGTLWYIPGSHKPTSGITKPRSRFQQEGFHQELDYIRRTSETEVSAIPIHLPAGGISLHHGLTLHGSGVNHASFTRFGISIGVATEHFRINSHIPCGSFIEQLKDPQIAPVVFERTM
ncbi:MAG TPA: hypothetical protein DCR93_12700 [Cytophagales bacterium]|nr:hypothetical protein [Cytophagales bacterium]HAP60305.1 hypothetical protein [Cytophagales bacterium]